MLAMWILFDGIRSRKMGMTNKEQTKGNEKRGSRDGKKF